MARYTKVTGDKVYPLYDERGFVRAPKRGKCTRNITASHRGRISTLPTNLQTHPQRKDRVPVHLYCDTNSAWWGLGLSISKEFATDHLLIAELNKNRREDGLFILRIYYRDGALNLYFDDLVEVLSYKCALGFMNSSLNYELLIND